MTPAGKRILALAAALAMAAIAVAGSWYGVQRVQTARADSLLAEANGHIERANQLLTELGIDALGAGDFSSLDNISKSSTLAGAAVAKLSEIRQETDAAAAAADRAAGLALLPGWFHDYLAKKVEVAGLRTRQVDNLEQKTESLAQLYDSGALIFTALQNRDRLVGEFEAAFGMIKDKPGSARDALGAVAQGLRSTESQLRSADQEKGFDLLVELADSTAGYAELAELAQALADAAAAGDQSRIQDSSAKLETKLEEAGLDTGFIDSWWQGNIAPLERSYQDLESRQQDLDTEAAVIYNRERRQSI